MSRSFVRVIAVAGSLTTLCVLSLGAQERGTRETKSASAVPQSAQPPAGLCRVWLENVPASQQPAPTDCATAIKNRPASARVVFGSLGDDEAKTPPKGSAPLSNPRVSSWPLRASEPVRRFDTAPGVSNRQNEPGNGVRTVNATTLVPRPQTTDSGGRVRRPER